MRSALIFSAHNSKGLSLVELLTAMAIIPVILFGASTISLQAAQLAQVTDVNSKAVTEMDNVMSTMSRIIENGVLRKTLSDGSTLDSAITSPSCSYVNDDGDTVDDTCYSLLVRIPGSTPGKEFTFYSTRRLLEMQDVADDNQPLGTPFQISYNKTIALPTDGVPFRFDGQAVTIHFRFRAANDEYRESSQTINLNGGNGVPA